MRYKRLLSIITFLLMVFFTGRMPLSVVAEFSPIITLAATSGTAGTAIVITGNGFVSNTSGSVWFDTNGNGIKDGGEPSRGITTTANGAIPNFTRVTAPVVPGGDYKVLVDIPGGEYIEAAADFTITPCITLSQKTGYAGALVTVSGNGFAAGAVGYIWFDTDNDKQRGDTEPSVSVTCDGNGVILGEITLTTPAAGPGTYQIKADMNSEYIAEASAIFTYSPTLTLSPSPVTSNLGAIVMDTVITITVSGGGFTPGASGYIWFDYDGNGARDVDESQVEVTATDDGTIPSGVTLTTPKLPPCSSFNVFADIPGSGDIESSAVLSIAETTTSVTITKHDAYGNVTDTTTVSWEWMRDNLPIIGDGETDYYIQKGTAISDTFDAVWDTQETDTDPDTLLEMGYARGTDVKDLLELVGGASEGDSVLFTASDGWKTWFDYENIYFPDSRQGKVVLSWWNGSNGGYVPEFYLGMRLYCFAETTNADGLHIYGDWDMHETMAPSRWEYSPIGPCTSRLSNKYVRYIDIYEQNLVSCDAAGTEKSDFNSGDTVYVKGIGLSPDTLYVIWIQPDGVQVSPLDELGLRNGTYTLSASDDPSGSQETVTTDVNGNFGPVAIWSIDSSSGAETGYDIVADNQSAGTVGTFDENDSIDNEGWEGFNACYSKTSSFSLILIGGIAAMLIIAAVPLILHTKQRKPHSVGSNKI